MSSTDLEETGRGSSLLDAFGGARDKDAGALMPMQSTHQTATRVVGAQRLAVKRDERDVLEKIKFIAATAGTDFYYRFPVKNRKENRTDYIEGPSIKAAMAVLRYYGNSAAECYAVEDLGAEWVFHARFIDYETGAELERPFRQRKSQATMGSDRERALDINFQIGVSKAVRNVIDGMLETFTEFAMEEAKQSIVVKIGERLPEWRARLAGRFAEMKFDLKRVEAVIGRSLDGWLAPDVARVLAMTKTIVDGFSSWDDMFPPLVAAGAGEGEGKAIAEFAEGKTADKPAEKPAEAKATAAEPKEKPAAAERADPKTGELIAVDFDALRAAGVAAKAAGKSRSAMPKELREPGRETEASAWLDGFSGREREPGEEG